MTSEKMRYCWDIMHCDNNTQCAVKENRIEKCWEWMRTHNEFQSQYNLCSECIVYLYHNRNSILSGHEMEQAMMRRGLFEKNVYVFDLHNLQ